VEGDAESFDVAEPALAGGADPGDQVGADRVQGDRRPRHRSLPTPQWPGTDQVLTVVAVYDPYVEIHVDGYDQDAAWGTEVFMREYDPARNRWRKVARPPNRDFRPASSRLMVLPTGQVMHTNATATMALLTPKGLPNPRWRPTITSAPRTVAAGQTFVLKGRQLNGLSQAVSIGDEGYR
jgi:hypothetical protein